MSFEEKLLKESDYKNFLDIIKKEDSKLYDISKQFSELTSETKRILDTIKEKSEDRKKGHGVSGEEHQRVDHHKSIPRNI